MLDFISKKICLNFEKWNGETMLLKQTGALLLSISQLKNISSHLLNLGSWAELLRAHSALHPTLTRLPAGSPLQVSVLRVPRGSAGLHPGPCKYDRRIRQDPGAEKSGGGERRPS